MKSKAQEKQNNPSHQILVDVVDSNDVTKFVELMKRDKSKDDAFSFSEALSVLDATTLNAVWLNLSKLCATTLLKLASIPQEEFDEAMQLVSGVVSVAWATTEMSNFSHPPEGMVQAVTVLSSVLLTLPAGSQQHVAALCEHWIKQQLANWNVMVGNTFIWLLQEAGEPQAQVSLVKRLWKIHDFLVFTNIDDANNRQVFNLLIDSVLCETFLKCEEGRRFVAHALGLSAQLFTAAHDLIKSILPISKKSVMEWYGEVYFRAWKLMTNNNRTAFENVCLQDLMHVAMHMPRKNSRSINAFRQVLSHTHRQKKQREVEEMLRRLYEPILWRSLKAPNGVVRVNALELLIEAFPLQDPNSSREERDELIQKQFDILQEMLNDPYPAARVTAVLGVCRICATYWDLIPVDVVKKLMADVVQELAWDTSSVEVRTAVVQGLKHLMGEVASHQLLQLVLPELKMLLHDKSEKVRVAFLDLLNKTKGFKLLKWWNIVTLDDLLARLEEDSQAVCRHVANLLMTSYWPPNKSPTVLVSRCFKLIDESPIAARVFYRHLIKHIETREAVVFFSTMCATLHGICKRKLTGDGSVANCNDTSDENDVEMPAEDDASQDQTNESASGKQVAVEFSEIPSEDTITGLVEIIAVMWIGIQPVLEKEQYVRYRDRLRKLLAATLPKVLKAYQSVDIVSATVLLSSHLPPSAVPSLSCGMLSRLRSLTEADVTSGNAMHETMLAAMCRWGRGTDILDLVSSWLSAAFDGGEGSSTTSNTLARKSRRVAFIEEPSNVSPQPVVALSYLRHLTSDVECRRTLLKSCRADLIVVRDKLSSVLDAIDKRLNNKSDDDLSDTLLLSLLEMYFVLGILLHEKDDKQHDVAVTFDRALLWAKNSLCLLLTKRGGGGNKRRLMNKMDATLLADDPGCDVTNMTSATLSETLLSVTLSDTLNTTSKRNADSGENEAAQLAVHALEKLLTMLSNALLVGIVSDAFIKRLQPFIQEAFRLDITHYSTLLTSLSVLVHQVAAYSVAIDDDEQRKDFQRTTVAKIVSDLLLCVRKAVSQRRAGQQALISELKPSLSDCHKVYTNVASFDSTASQDITQSAVRCIINDVRHLLSKDVPTEVYTSLEQLPSYAALLLTLFSRKPQIASVLATSLGQWVQADSTSEVEDHLAAAHVALLLHLVVKPLPEEVSLCGSAVRERLNHHQCDALPDNSPIRLMLEAAKTLLDQQQEEDDSSCSR